MKQTNNQKVLTTMLQEHTLHLVKQDNEGKDLTNLNNLYLLEIATVFGGFTVTEARGGWVNPNGKLYDEPVLRVTVALADNVESLVQFKLIAYNYKVAAKQEAVYIVTPKNGVEFI